MTGHILKIQVVIAALFPMSMKNQIHSLVLLYVDAKCICLYLSKLLLCQNVYLYIVETENM